MTRKPVGVIKANKATHGHNIMTSCLFERNDREYAPFDAQGGHGKMHQLFGDQMDALIEEHNGELAT